MTENNKMVNYRIILQKHVNSIMTSANTLVALRKVLKSMQ